MEKILLVLDAASTEMGALDFACYIAKLNKSKLTGVFLENISLTAEEADNEEEPGEVPKSFGGPTVYAEADVDRQKKIQNNIQQFISSCERRGVHAGIHRDRGVAIDEIVEESRYADLIIVSASLSAGNKPETSPSRLLKAILKDAECPVTVAPEQFEGIDEIIFTYNGSKSSVFAIKQFTYLLSSLEDKKVIVLQVNEDGEWTTAEKYKMKEWLKDHYSAIGFEVLKGKTDAQMLSYFLPRKNAMVVMGAYGRSSLSQFFRPSQAEVLIRTILQPIFIAHY